MNKGKMMTMIKSIKVFTITTLVFAIIAISAGKFILGSAFIMYAGIILLSSLILELAFKLILEDT